MPVSEPGVYMLTGPVGSGKTTSLIAWIENKKEVYGILTPVVDGKRMFMDVHTKTQFPMEATEQEPATIAVGRFLFSKTNFEKATGIIRDAMNREGWLIIDEIGPLELRGEGFHDILKDILAGRTGKLLLVVRDNNEIPERVKAGFNLHPVACITTITGL